MASFYAPIARLRQSCVWFKDSTTAAVSVPGQATVSSVDVQGMEFAGSCFISVFFFLVCFYNPKTVITDLEKIVLFT